MRKTFSLLLIPLLTLVLTACPASGSGGGPDAPKVTGVTLDETTLTLAIGATGTLTATVAGDDGVRQDVTWSSDTPAVATVDAGVVTAVAAGTARITATSTVDTTKSASATVTVTAAGGGGNEPDPDDTDSGFSLSLPLGSLDVPFHASAPLTVNVNRTGDFTGAVTVSVSGLPAEVTAGTLTIAAGSDSGSLMISHATDGIALPVGTGITVSGAAGELNDSATFDLQVLPVVTSALDAASGDPDYPLAGSLRDLVMNVPTSAAEPTTITFDEVAFAAPTIIQLTGPLSFSSARPLKIIAPTGENGKLLVTLFNPGRTLTVNNLASLELDNVIVTGQGSNPQSGGAIYNAGTLHIRNSLITGNSANTGGGIYNTGVNADLTLTGSTVHGNSSATTGGGIASANNGKVTVINSTISGNEAATNGGGINSSGNVTISNSTISENTAETGSGGGISVGGRLDIGMSIVAGNTAGGTDPDLRIAGTQTSSGYNVIGNVNIMDFSAATFDQLNVNPQLNPLGDYGGPTPTHSLSANSPAKNTIPSILCPATDQRGEPRPGASAIDSHCDSGAYEAQ
jgi:predicted outer membrane repeat protein